MKDEFEMSEQEMRWHEARAHDVVVAEGDLWALAGIREGARVLHAGCGTGFLLARFGIHAGDTGQVVGIEPNVNAARVARNLVRSCQQTNVEVVQSNIEDAPLEPESFDVVMCRDVLAHNGPRVHQILGKLATFVRPGGSLYLSERDVGATRTCPADTVIDQLTDAFELLMQKRGNDLRVAPTLPHLLECHGFHGIAVHPRIDTVPATNRFRGLPWTIPEDKAGGDASEIDTESLDRALAQRQVLPHNAYWFFPTYVAFGFRR